LSEEDAQSRREWEGTESGDNGYGLAHICVNNGRRSDADVRKAEGLGRAVEPPVDGSTPHALRARS